MPPPPAPAGTTPEGSSTPHSSAAEYSLEDVMKNTIYQFLFIDIQNNQICDAEKFLRALLQFCCTNELLPPSLQPSSDIPGPSPISPDHPADPILQFPHDTFDSHSEMSPLSSLTPSPEPPDLFQPSSDILRPPSDSIPQSPLNTGELFDLSPFTSPKPRDLFQQCLNEVVDRCNLLRDQVNTGREEDGARMDELQTELNKYRNTYLERDCYRYFAHAVNLALEVLKGIDLVNTGLPAAPKGRSEILFHVNDEDISTTRMLKGSLFKPDIAVVTRDAAWSVVEDAEIYTEDDLTFRLSTKSPAADRSFGWDQILMSVELKTYGKKIAELGSQFDADTPIEPVPPLVVDSWIDRRTQAESVPPESKPDAPMSDASEDSNASADPVASGSTHVPRATLLPPAGARRPNRLAGKQPTESPSKRKAEESLGGRPSKKRQVGSGSPPGDSRSPNTTTSTERLEFDPAVQSAIYALERFNHAPIIAHVLNLVIDDDVARLFWYDREGVVQSTGINIFTNFPHFMVLLLILQRFNLAHWGVIAGLELKQSKDVVVQLSGHGDDTSISDSNFSSSTELTVHTEKPIYARYSLLGRGTMLFNATIDQPQSKLVAKVYWPEASRDKEDDIIAKAHKYGQASRWIYGHIPDVILRRDFSELSTSRIRGLFGFKPSGKTRVFRIIVFRKLRPIIELGGEEFWRAYWECFICHYELWKKGIHHGDISANNLMYDDKEGIKRGVLNDFDLARLARSDPGLRGKDRTGTMPFMALDLLTKEGFNGELERLYRHDAESFAWSLIYIFVCIEHLDSGPVEHRDRLDKWLVTNYDGCRTNKMVFPIEIINYHPTASYKKYWKAAVKLVSFWATRYAQVMEARFELSMLTEEGEEQPSLDEDQSVAGRGDSGGGDRFLEALAKELVDTPVVAPVAPATLVEASPDDVLRDVMTCMSTHNHNILKMLMEKGKGKQVSKGGGL